MSVKPPQRAERLIRWSLAPWERPAILGDLSEEFEQILGQKGAAGAGRWYWLQVVRSIWPNLVRRVRGDEDRSRRARVALWQFGFAGYYFVLGFVRDRFPWPAILWLSTGMLLLLDSVFRKRQIRPRPLPVGGRRFLLFVGLILTASALTYSLQRWAISDAQVVAFMVAAQFVTFVWPRRARSDGDAFEVRHKLSPDIERVALLTVSVPNEPYGLSRVILRRASGREASNEAARALHTYDPIIERAFAPSQQIRAFALVNLPDTPKTVSARVDLVSPAGVVVKRVVAPIVGGHLEEVGRWNDFADKDPAEHFGQIDATIPLEGLAAGEYKLRVSVGDRAARSTDDEPISIMTTKAPNNEITK